MTLYVHLRENIAKRLHHGLSETILVNTLTDIREFKNGLLMHLNSLAKQIDKKQCTVKMKSI